MTQTHIGQTPIERVLERVEGIKPGDGSDDYKALCPAHDDHNPSLGIKEADDGRVLLNCRAGCEKKEVLDAIGLDWPNLFPNKNRALRRGKHTATYEIRDQDGQLVAYHVCYDNPDGGKDCLWQQADGKTWGLNGTPLKDMPLYGTECVAGWPEGAGVVLVEGEPAKDALEAVRIKALGTVTGAKQTPSREVLEVLRDRPVCLFPDNDAEGRDHMRRVGRNLEGIAGEVRWFEWADAPKKGDAADHPAVRDRDYGDLFALRRQMAAAPLWEEVAQNERQDDAPREPGSRALYELTDLGNADRFVKRHGGRVRYCPAMRSFLLWDGKRWKRDSGYQARALAQDTARSIHHEAVDATDKDEQRSISRWALASQSAARIEAMLGQAIPHLIAEAVDLDADPMLLNCQNGTVDLRTGELREHDPEDLITRISSTAYDPDARAPRFEQFLEETLVGEELVEFVKRFAGYSLTGDTRERAMAILYGSGKNGKSTLVELVHETLGDYAQNTDVETVLAKRYQGVGNEVAALKGARFVSCSEVEKGRRLAESKVKQLTGRDTVTARFLFSEPFDFRPEFKLWMSTNNKPEIRGTDDAIWDRIRLIPFTQRFEGRRSDPRLSEKLREELPGVLAWMVAGCLAWQRDGLNEPDEVTNATDAYRSEMDSLAGFIEECCAVHKDASAPFKALYERYTTWCEEAGETAEKKRSFGNLLTERGYLPGRGTGNAPIRHGIGLLADREPPPDDGPGGAPEGNSGREQVTPS